MFERVLRRNRTAVQCVLPLLVAMLPACSKKSAGGNAAVENAGPASSGAQVRPAAHAPSASAASCRSLGRGASFTLGTPDADRAHSDGSGPSEAPADGSASGAENEGDLEQPFATELGSTLASGDGFWVTALDNRNGKSHAVIAKIESTVDRGTVVDLGRVYGDAEPPKAALLEEKVLVAVADSTAAGRLVKLGQLLATQTVPHIEWVEDVEQGADDSPVFSLATSAKSVLLAWDDIDRSSRRGIVLWRRVFEHGAARTLPEPKGKLARGQSSNGHPSTKPFATALEQDAEAPQLLPRPGGFWLSYLSSVGVRATKNARAVAATQKSATNEDDNRQVVELGKRTIQLTALDYNGAVVGQGIAVTEPSTNVVAFDAEALADGGVIVAYRQANTAPGVEDDEILVTQVRPDGSFVRMKLEDERFGAGMPVVLTAASGNPSSDVWLVVGGKSGDGLLSRFIPGESTLGAVATEPALSLAEPLVRVGDHLLISHVRGKAAEFEPITCIFPAKPSSK